MGEGGCVSGAWAGRRDGGKGAAGWEGGREGKRGVGRRAALRADVEAEGLDEGPGDDDAAPEVRGAQRQEVPEAVPWAGRWVGGPLSAARGGAAGETGKGWGRNGRAAPKMTHIAMNQAMQK